jgi:hypothetical protein
MSESTSYSPSPENENVSRDSFDVHRQMVIALFAATLLFVVLMVLGILNANMSILMVVAVAGSLGGFISALRRAYTFQRVFPSDFFRSAQKINLYLIIYSMIPSLVGAIAAAVLYLIFASRLISGELFPAFDLLTTNPKADEFDNFVNNWAPAGPVDYAKCIVWGFISGFSERFVPDIIERLTSKVSESNKENE